MSLKALDLARKCLKKAVNEKNEKHRDSLMFQFCRQMQRFSNQTSEQTNDELQVKKFQEFSRQFGVFARIYRAKNLLRKVIA